MQAFDYSVIAVLDSEAAKTEITKAIESGMPFDAVLIDQNLDRTSAASIRQALAPDDPSPATRGILLTNRGLSGEAASQINPLIDSYLSEPMRPSRLFTALTPARTRTPAMTGVRFRTTVKSTPRSTIIFGYFWRKTTT